MSSVASRPAVTRLFVGVVSAEYLEVRVSQCPRSEEEAEERLEQLQEQLAEAVSRLRRIRQIRKKVKERSEEAFQRGMAELEADDELLPALDSHEFWVASDLGALGVPSDADFSIYGLGVADGTGGVEAGSSGGA